MNKCLLPLFLVLSASLEAQISIVTGTAGANQVSASGVYEQKFNTLVASGAAVTWADNSTLKGWYAAKGPGTTPTPDNTPLTTITPNYATPGNTSSGILYSMAQHFTNNTATSTYRALGGAPSGGNGPINLGLRFVNNTSSTITGFSVNYEIKFGYTESSGGGKVTEVAVTNGGSGYTSAPTVTFSAGTATGTAIVSGGSVVAVTVVNTGSGYSSAPTVSFSGGGGTGAAATAIIHTSSPTSGTNTVDCLYKTFAAGGGTLAGIPTGWGTADTRSAINQTTSAVPDDWDYVTKTISGLSLAPGQEIWLDWRITKVGSNNVITAIDNVRVGDFALGDPAIMTQPLDQSVISGRSPTFNVVASGTASPTYQWRKNGSNIVSATNTALTINNALSGDAGTYDVVVTRGANSVTSTAAKLRVYTSLNVRGPDATSSRSPNVSITGTGLVPSLIYTGTASLKNIVFLPAARGEKADIYLPDPLPAICPAVVIIHGGGGNDGDKDDDREITTGQEFARRGYVAMSIDYKRSFNLGNGKWSTSWPQNIMDAKTAVRYLRANAATYHIDVNRIGAIGFSWGGNEAAMLATTKVSDNLEPTDGYSASISSSVACASNFYGAVSIPDYHNMNQFGGYGVPGVAGTMDYSGTNNYLIASPAINYSVNSGAAPLLLCHGDADLEVMPSQNFALKATLINAGNKVDGVILVPNGIHSYALYDETHGGTAATPIDVRPQTFGFYDRYLLPPVLTSSTTATATSGTAFSYQIAATNYPDSYNATGLPSGLSVNTTTGIISGTTFVTGTSNVTISATNTAGTDSKTLVLTIQSAYTGWASTHLVGYSVAQQSATADPDGDGVNNLLEYSQGGDPTINDSATRLPVGALSGNNFVFTYRKDGVGLIYAVEQTSDLATVPWSPVAQPEVDNGNGTFSRSVPIGGDKLFLQLRVTAQ